LLAPKLSGMEAAEEITRAIRKNRCRLICDDKVVQPHIAAIATVVPKLDPDGRWIADVESTGAGLGWARGLNWELEVDEVTGLLPNQKPRRKPGPKPKGSWTELIRRELKRIGRKRTQELENSGELTSKLVGFLDSKIGWAPADLRNLNTIKRDFLNGKL
jgi:hypothetical protein